MFVVTIAVSEPYLKGIIQLVVVPMTHWERFPSMLPTGSTLLNWKFTHRIYKVILKE
jgi:hypothetical protein